MAAAFIWPQASHAASPQTPEQVVRAMFEAFNTHDVDALVALYSDDAVLNGPEYCQPKTGKAAVRDVYSALFQTIPDVHDTIKTLVVTDDTVALEFVATGHIEDFAIQLPIAAFLTVKDGLIVSDTAYFDTDAESNCPAAKAQ